MCSERHEQSALKPTEEFVVSSLLLVRGMTVPVRHVQASTEACQTIECNLSFQICVILCRRLGSRNDLSSRQQSKKNISKQRTTLQKNKNKDHLQKTKKLPKKLEQNFLQKKIKATCK